MKWYEISSNEVLLRRAWASGKKLLAKRESMAHGQWRPWLKARGINYQTAYNRMRIAAAYSEAEFVEKGSVRAALRDLQAAAAE